MRNSEMMILMKYKEQSTNKYEVCACKKKTKNKKTTLENVGGIKGKISCFRILIEMFVVFYNSNRV